jgi:hypothetical protein
MLMAPFMKVSPLSRDMERLRMSSPAARKVPVDPKAAAANRKRRSSKQGNVKICQKFFSRFDWKENRGTDEQTEQEFLYFLMSPRIDSKVPMPPGCVACQVGTTTQFLLGS